MRHPKTSKCKHNSPPIEKWEEEAERVKDEKAVFSTSPLSPCHLPQVGGKRTKNGEDGGGERTAGIVSSKLTSTASTVSSSTEAPMPEWPEAMEEPGPGQAGGDK